MANPRASCVGLLDFSGPAAHHLSKVSHKIRCPKDDECFHGVDTVAHVSTCTRSPVKDPYDHQAAWGWFRKCFVAQVRSGCVIPESTNEMAHYSNRDHCNSRWSDVRPSLPRENTDVQAALELHKCEIWYDTEQWQPVRDVMKWQTTILCSCSTTHTHKCSRSVTTSTSPPMTSWKDDVLGFLSMDLKSCYI